MFASSPLPPGGGAPPPATSPTNHTTPPLLLGHTMLHQKPKNYGSLGHGKRSPQKKAAVTTFKGARLLKWLVAYCVLDCVSATAETMPALSPFTSPSPTCGCSEEFVAMGERHAAELKEARQEFQDGLAKVNQQLQDVRQCSGCVSPSPPPPSPSPPP
eukprot:scaffold75142_cov57-Phaeocystis_antarctica.AAC.2